MAPHKRLDEIKLEDIDFEAVKECTDKEVLKRYLKLLEADGNYFHDLVDACKEKLLEVCPKDYYLLFPRVATAQELDDITKDLLDWQEAVAETDAELKKSKKKSMAIWDDLPGANVTAPIRGQEPVVARPHLQKKELETKDRANRPSKDTEMYARDKTKMRDYYSAWDQVDVDAIEADMDREEHEAEEARKRHFDDLRDEQVKAHEFTAVKTGNLPEGVPDAHRRHMADSEKEKGNEAFYAKDFEEAEAYYTRSLHFRADDPSNWANRALVRLKLNNAAGALEDCEHSLAINPRYMKALHRKGKALYDLARYEEAVQHFQLALMESPGNTQINGDLMMARRKLRSDGPAPTQKSERPRRIDDEPSCVIEEVVDDEDEVGDATSSAPPAAGPAAGYTRVVIEDDSESEEETEEIVMDKLGTTPGFHKVQIQEDSEDSEEGEPEREPAATPEPGPAKTVTAPAAAPGFHKVQIVDDSESEEEATVPVTQAGFHKVQIVDDSESDEDCAPSAPATKEITASAPEACSATETFHFDDMD